jgi:hypothetical protein
MPSGVGRNRGKNCAGCCPADRSSVSESPAGLEAATGFLVITLSALSSASIRNCHGSTVVALDVAFVATIYPDHHGLRELTCTAAAVAIQAPSLTPSSTAG